MNIEEEYFIKDEPTFFQSKEDLRKLLGKMVEYGASGLFILGERRAWISTNAGKKQITKKTLSTEECKGLLAEAYNSISALNLIFSVTPLNFMYQFETEHGTHRFRVNAIASTYGNAQTISMTFRLINSTPPKAEDLGIPEEIVRTCVENEKGIIYVCGATGQGKSTTLAAIIRHILEKEDSNVNMVDIGEPIEFVYDNISTPTSFVTQLNVGKDVRSFKEGVENCMRMEPQIIQISESKDTGTIQASLDASKSGHAVYTTVHSGSVPESLRRIVNMFPMGMRSSAQLDVVESTQMIVAQQLIPTVDNKKIAIREYLIFDSEVKEELWKSENIAKTAIEVLKRKGHPMSIDIEKAYEIGRITKETRDKYIGKYENLVKSMENDEGGLLNG